MSKQKLSIPQAFEHRRFLTSAAAGTVVVALGAHHAVADGDPPVSQRREDVRIRLPPGRRLMERLKPMGGGVLLVLAGLAVPVAHVVATGGP